MKETTMRRSILITMLSGFFFANSFAQKTETSISFNSGLFSFSGPSAQSSTFINYDDATKSGYTNNYYGSKKALCYGFSFQRKRIAGWNLILGYDLGYEVLRSKISINQIAEYDSSSNINHAASGKSISNFGFINFFPYIGYRIKVKNISLDITCGFELAIKFKSWETGNAKTTNGTKILMSSNSTGSNLFDIRRRIQVAVNYKRISPYIGYSVGLINYITGKVGGNQEAYSRMLRIGIGYKI